MKNSNFILLLFVFILFCSGSCESPQSQYFITIQNDSDKEILFQGALYFSVAQDTTCFINSMTKMEYQNFIHYRLIKPHESRKIEIDYIVKELKNNPNMIWSLGIFNRIDVDTLSCEEFKHKFPLKKEWKVTVADMEEDNWTLVYP